MLSIRSLLVGVVLALAAGAGIGVGTSAGSTPGGAAVSTTTPAASATTPAATVTPGGLAATPTTTNASAGAVDAMTVPAGVSPPTIKGIDAGATVPANLTGPVDAAFLGDSYTYGIGATKHSDSYAYLVAQAEHWTAKIVGLPGSGYVRVAIKDHKRIDDGIPAIIESDPKIVFVECGHNDADDGIPLSRVEPNALRDLRRLRRGLPHATIVVLGPIWLSQKPTERAIAVRSAVHTAQRQIPNSVWIDPIQQGWFTGDRILRTGDDRTMINYSVGHPNDLGYEHIASMLEADLARLKLTDLG